MQTDDKNINANEPEQSTAWLDTSAAKFTGAIAAIAATAYTAKDAITRAFFKTINKGDAGAFTDLQSARDKKISEILAPTKTGVAVPDALSQIKVVNNEYDAAYKARRTLLNVHNVFDEAKALKAHQWNEVLFSTAAVGSVAVGAILAITTSRDAARKDQQDDKNISELERLRKQLSEKPKADFAAR